MGLGFIHVGFLAAMAAVAVPIVIHLLFRQRARKVEIGSLRFVRVALRDQASRRKLKRWLLLALRAAGVILLALLFARPYRNAPEAAGSEREVVFLIDRSASMAAKGAGATPFDKAQRLAGELLGALPAGAAAHLAYFDSDGVAPAREARIDPAARPGLAATDFSKALAWARDIVVGSRRLRREVHLFTDLQRAGMGAPLADRFPPEAAVDIVDVGRSVTRNVAVEAVEAESTDLRAGKPVRITARVFNAGVFAARGVRVRLALDGQPALEQTTDVAGGEHRLVRFEVPVRDVGLYHGSVAAVGDDDLPFDDRRWLAFAAQRPARVLLVDGQPGPSVYGNETYYLEAALLLRVPGQEPAEGERLTPYEPARLAWNGGSGSLPDLSAYRMVALCNVAGVSPADGLALGRFASSGGGVVIFTGDQARAEGYAALESAGLLPGRVEKPAEAGPYRFVAWRKDHPVFAPFADPLHGDLRTVRFTTISHIVPGPQARVLARAAGDAPLVLERTCGQGRCLLCAFPADNAWGDWAIHRLYLPLVHQVAGYLCQRLPEDGLVRSAPAATAANQGPGVTIESGHALVRNVDPAESEIERTTIETLRERYRLPTGQPGRGQAPDELDTLTQGGERPDELWRLAAWGLLVVLVIETFVANRTYA